MVSCKELMKLRKPKTVVFAEGEKNMLKAAVAYKNSRLEHRLLSVMKKE